MTIQRQARVDCAPGITSASLDPLAAASRLNVRHLLRSNSQVWPTMGVDVSSLTKAQLAALVDHRELELIILPTEKCNFRCTYCYETFELGRMSMETISALKALIANRVKELARLSINWFGGEPLAATDIVLEVSEYAQALCSLEDVQFSSSATTNGWTLDADAARRLCEVGVTHFQITLDGPPDIHNQRRLLPDGRGTFERIWANLNQLNDSDLALSVLIRVHYDQESVAGVLDLIDLIDAAGFDSRFHVQFKQLERLGGSNDQLIQILPRSLRKPVQQRLQQALRSVQVFEPPLACYAARPNSLVIRSDGRIAKCTVAFGDERNDVGRLRYDGSLELDSVRMAKWFKPLATGSPEQLACPLSSLS